MLNFKKQRGITLISLIITIVVMLILAGVTINLTIGQNGIFKIAQQAAKKYTNAQEKEIADLSDFNNVINNTINNLGGNDEENIPPELGTIIKTENNINYTADGAGNIIPVPIGFRPITAEEGQGTKKTGFVIRNDKDKNEFVWIPVEGMGYTYNRYDFGYPSENYADYSEAVSSDEQMSVTEYEGYYIGRYEAGIASLTERKATDRDTTKTAEQIETTWGKALSQNGKHTYNFITRAQAKELAENVYVKADDNVTSKLCSSYAWDTALRFIDSNVANAGYITNSTRGNYSGSLKVTGQTMAVNNIYDMGGNVWEWTTEECSGTDIPCVLRGCSYGDDISIASSSVRVGCDTKRAEKYIAFRITLFI